MRTPIYHVPSRGDSHEIKGNGRKPKITLELIVINLPSSLIDALPAALPLSFFCNSYFVEEICPLHLSGSNGTQRQLSPVNVYL